MEYLTFLYIMKNLNLDHYLDSVMGGVDDQIKEAKTETLATSGSHGFSISPNHKAHFIRFDLKKGDFLELKIYEGASSHEQIPGTTWPINSRKLRELPHQTITDFEEALEYVFSLKARVYAIRTKI